MTGALSAGEFRYIEYQNYRVGRFVAIYFDHPGVLTVCEFEVSGWRTFLKCHGFLTEIIMYDLYVCMYVCMYVTLCKIKVK